MATPGIKNPFTTILGLLLDRPPEDPFLLGEVSILERFFDGINESWGGWDFDWFLTYMEKKYAKREDVAFKKDAAFRNKDLIEGLLNCLATSNYSNLGPDTARPEIWTHFKGGKYLVEKVVTQAGDLQPAVVYVCMEQGKYFVRPCSEWNEVVRWPDGKYRSRFMKMIADLLQFSV